MVIRSILAMAFIVVYFLPLLLLLLVGLRAKASSKYADKMGFMTKGDWTQFMLLSLIPVVNVIMFGCLVSDWYEKTIYNSEPLHK